MRAVEAFGLVEPGQPGKEHDHISVLRRRDGFVDERLVRSAEPTVVARCKGQRRRVIDRGLQGGPGIVQGPGIHLRAAGALVARPLRKSADHGDALAAGQRQQAVVAEQHRGLHRRLSGQGMVGRTVDRLLARCEVGTQEVQADRAHDGPIDHRLVQLAGLHGAQHALVVHAAAAGHFQIQAGGNPGGPVIGGAPIRHDQPLEAPVVAEHLVQEPVVLAAIGTVEAVVRTHHRPGLRFAHRDFKPAQIQLAQGALVHNRVDGHAPVFLIVGREVLDRGAYAPGLHAANQCGGQLARQQRVFRKVLEVAAAKRVSLDVHAGPKQHSDLLGDTLVAQRLADLLQQHRVPAAGQGAGGRETGGGHRAVRAHVVRLPRLLAQPVRAIGDHDARNLQPLVAGQVPEAVAAQLRGFFLQAHLRNQGTGLVVFGFQAGHEGCPRKGPAARARIGSVSER